MIKNLGIQADKSFIINNTVYSLNSIKEIINYENNNFKMLNSMTFINKSTNKFNTEYIFKNSAVSFFYFAMLSSIVINIFSPKSNFVLIINDINYKDNYYKYENIIKVMLKIFGNDANFLCCNNIKSLLEINDLISGFPIFFKSTNIQDLKDIIKNWDKINNNNNLILYNNDVNILKSLNLNSCIVFEPGVKFFSLNNDLLEIIKKNSSYILHLFLYNFYYNLDKYSKYFILNVRNAPFPNIIRMYQIRKLHIHASIKLVSAILNNISSNKINGNIVGNARTRFEIIIRNNLKLNCSNKDILNLIFEKMLKYSIIYDDIDNISYMYDKISYSNICIRIKKNIISVRRSAIVQLLTKYKIKKREWSQIIKEKDAKLYEIAMLEGTGIKIPRGKASRVACYNFDKNII